MKNLIGEILQQQQQQQQNGSSNLGPKTRSYNISTKKKKRICKIVDFSVPADIQNKTKRMDKYLDLARELKKLWNMNGTIVLIVIGAFGTKTKGPGGFGRWWTSGDHPNDSIIEDG